MNLPSRRPTFRPVRRRSALLAAALFLASLAGSAPVGAADTTAIKPQAVTLGLTSFLTGLTKPVLLTHAGDGTGRLFVVEQTGRIKVFAADGTPLGTLLNLSSYVSKGGEQGLLGLAFHPQFETNRKFYVYFTNPRGDIGINEYTVSASNPLSAGNARRILSIDHPPMTNHNGGHMAFGPDGLLYIGTGDGGGSGDPGNRAQSINSLLGKLLRINVDGTQGAKRYRIPSTNPYRGRTGLDEIWARGLRNPWRWSFDRLNGNLWIGDVGQNRWEEINRVNGAGRAANYGWRVQEGRACFRPASGCVKRGKVQPLAVVSHAGGNCSITGGYVYRGSAYQALQGTYLFGDFCSGRIWSLPGDGSSGSPTQLLDTNHFISSFGEDEAGELYVTDLVGGTVYKVSAS